MMMATTTSTASEEDALLRGEKQPQIEEDGTGREHGHGLQIEEDGTGREHGHGLQIEEDVTGQEHGHGLGARHVAMQRLFFTGCHFDNDYDVQHDSILFLGLRLRSTGTIKSKYEWVEAGRMRKETSRRKRDSQQHARGPPSELTRLSYALLFLAHSFEKIVLTAHLERVHASATLAVL